MEEKNDDLSVKEVSMISADTKMKLALEALDSIRYELLMRMPYLEMALFYMSFKEVGDLDLPKELKVLLSTGALDPFGTDGRYLYFGIDSVLDLFYRDDKALAKKLLHTLVHCLFHHNVIRREVEKDLWDLAADISAECILEELGVPSDYSGLLRQLESAIPFLSVGNLYSWLSLCKMANDEGDLYHSFLDASIQLDNHMYWYSNDGDGSDSSNSNGGGDSIDFGVGAAYSSSNSTADKWKEIAENTLIDMQASGLLKGDVSGFFSEYLKKVTRDEYDYTEFLKKFGTITEAMKVNPDEFDYVYYSYGMDLYENMPLVEPLEYQEKHQVSDFVIVLDTSGSISNELLRRYLTKTYSVLKEAESFTHRINVHIIQCDADVTMDKKITSQEELDAYLQSDFKVVGRGGTDFRPVFKYVDEMLKKGEFSKLEGLLYFTDGYGDFPKCPPKYKTAFVFCDNTNVEIPSWAMKVVWKD